MINILKYYAQEEVAPAFYTFDNIDKKKLDVAAIAKHIYDTDMGQRKKTEYINELWENGDDNILRLFFGRKIYFWKQVEIELMKLSDSSVFDGEANVEYGRRELADMSLYEIGRYDPQYEKELRDGAFEAALDADGFYVCAGCGRREKGKLPFQVDHIIPMNRGGKSVPENLQILCRSCNAKKSDKE